MTDNETIKCLQICSTYGGKCTACPAYVKVDRSNCKQVLVGALDIINRQQAEIERLKECPKCVYEYDGETTMECVERAIRYAPTADVAEVKHGEWKWTESGEEDYEQYWVCSCCSDKSYIEENFCPNCGADMRGEQCQNDT